MRRRTKAVHTCQPTVGDGDCPAAAENAEMRVAADERRSTLIENSVFYPRLSAAQDRVVFPDLFISPLV
jgi:hypothetical protein